MRRRASLEPWRARNRRRFGVVLPVVFVACLLGSWAMASVEGYGAVDVVVAALLFTVLVFPLVWYVVKE